jgi:hypothetical protein
VAATDDGDRRRGGEV